VGTAVSKSSLKKASSLRAEKLGANIGAEISGVDLARKLNRADVRLIKDAFVEHEVLVFRNQDLSQDQYINFTSQLGELTIHPFATALPDHPELIVLDNDKDNPPLSTDQWHSDEMFRQEPPWATALRSAIVPKIGGDTCFASMTSAYDGLLPSLQEFYASLEAVNDFKVFRVLYSGTREGRQRLVELEDMFPNATHPVVRVHPMSKKKAIYVSPQTTKYIANVRDFESEHILHMLYQLPEIPEYQLRVRWEPNMIVLWDNISTQHYAPRDFLPYRRRMERLTIKGSRPYGVAGKKKHKAVRMNVRGTASDSRTGQHRKGLARPANTILKSG
jgi:taurine dioxygenase